MSAERLNIMPIITKDINDFKLESFSNQNILVFDKDKVSRFNVTLLLNGLIDIDYNVHLFICSYSKTEPMRFLYMGGFLLKKDPHMTNVSFTQNFSIEFLSEGFYELRVFLIPTDKDSIKFESSSFKKEELDDREENEIFTNNFSILKSAILFKMINKHSLTF